MDHNRQKMDHNRQKMDHNRQMLFEQIYQQKEWGGRKRFWRPFFSGYGSCESEIVGPYVRAVAPIISGKAVVDVGCGDFSVGKKLCPFAARYVACDIVRSLIAYNSQRFKSKKFKEVEFVLLDAVEDELPAAEIILLRQVLQHLDNESIEKILRKLRPYRTAIITEHLPVGSFVPNVDKFTSVENRLSAQSGIVVTQPPFLFRARRSQILCEMPSRRGGGIIQTTLYEL